MQRWLCVEQLFEAFNAGGCDLPLTTDRAKAAQGFKGKAEGGEEGHELTHGFFACDDLAAAIDQNTQKAETCHDVDQAGNGGGTCG